MLERYNNILSAIRALWPTAHIGGGAVRDTLLDRSIEDIDIFLDDGVSDDAAWLLRSEFGYVKVGEWKQYLGFSDPAIARLARFEKHDEATPIALIGLQGEASRGIEANLSRFDFGVCMVAWDGDKVHTLPEYRRDIEAKTFTLCRADNYRQFAYSISRFDKITADRYAGWKLVVPVEFEAMAKEHALRKTHYFDRGTDEWMPREVFVDGPQLLTPKAR
jgi:hypothetical protein